VRSGFWDSLAAGLVVTGGTTIMEGVPEVAEDVLGIPARRAFPGGVGGIADVVRSPAHATGVGLIRYGARAARQPARPMPVTDRGMFKRMWSRMTEIF